MKILKFSLFIFLTMSQFFLFAEKVCNPNESIAYQKKRYISQGLLINVAKDKILFSWPVKVCNCWISSLFGKRGSGFHAGVDFAATKGTQVYAVADGYVKIAQQNLDPKGYGNMVLIDHQDSGYKSRYAHLNSLSVSQGQQVEQGQKIGTVGSTGHVITKHGSDPSHLHFEIYKGDKRVDPLSCLFASDIALLKVKKKLATLK